MKEGWEDEGEVIHTYIHTYIQYSIHTYIHTIYTYIHTYIHTVYTYIHTYIHTVYTNAGVRRPVYEARQNPHAKETGGQTTTKKRT